MTRFEDHSMLYGTTGEALRPWVIYFSLSQPMLCSTYASLASLTNVGLELFQTTSGSCLSLVLMLKVK